MAEFIEVMKEYHRLCSTYLECYECPFYGLSVCGKIAEVNDNETNDFEKIVMEWAKEHPELQYPTWNEWMLKEFGVDEGSLCGRFRPCVFTGEKCDNNKNCTECRNRQIPEEIAKKLGIKPKEQSNATD